MAVDPKYVGRSFDDFLEEEGIYTEVCQTATKRILAWQIEQLMRHKGLTKKAMAMQMKTSRTSLRRLLDPENESVTLQTMTKAAAVLGKSVKIDLVDTSDIRSSLDDCKKQKRGCPAL